MRRDERPTRPITKEAKRVCLSCEKKFNSSGPGNRICAPCKHKQTPGPIGHTNSGKRLNGIELAS